MRHVPAHPASPHAAGHNGEAPLVTDLSLDHLEPDVRAGAVPVFVNTLILRAPGRALEPDRR
jgi:hypothetical protein